MDRNNTNTMRQVRALRTIASLFNGLLLDIGVSLVLSSPYSCLILVLATISFAYGVKILIISLSKAFAGPIATLLTAIFYSIVLGYQVILGNFFRGSSLSVSYRSFPQSSILYPYPILIALVISFRVLFYILILFIVL